MKHHRADLIAHADCSAKQVRCLCRQLLARVIDTGIELKCKRCRQLVTIPFSRIAGFPDKLMN
jgi:hypothetical protein